MHVYFCDPLPVSGINSVSSTYVSAALVMIREFRRLQKVIPLDSSEIAPSNMHVIANQHRAGLGKRQTLAVFTRPNFEDSSSSPQKLLLLF